MQVSDPLTDHLPQIERMISALESEQYETLFEDYHELDATFGILYGTYVDELHYLAADEPQNEVAERIGVQFSELRPFLNALRDDLSLEDLDAALDTLKGLKEEATTLYALFGEYRQVALEAPRYSEVPYTHELIRVCKHYLKGALSIEAVQGRFEVFCNYHEALEQQLASLVPSPPEREAFEERAEDIEEALALQLQAMEDLDFALEHNEESEIAEALENLAEAAEVLVEVYRHLQKADLEPVKVSCIRCGAENPTDARMCGACGAVIPQSAANVGPNSTMAFEEDGSAVGPKESEELLRMEEAFHLFLHSGEPDKLEQALISYQRKMERIKRQFGRMDDPPAEIPAEHLAILQRARQSFRQTLQALEAGLAKLQEGFASAEPLLLEEGLAEMRAGNELFNAFQAEFEAARSLSG